MDIKTVKNLVAILENSSLNRLEVEDQTDGGTLRVSLEKNAAGVAPQVVVRESAIMQQPTERPVQPAVDGAGESILDYNLVEEVTSPMVGIFYAAPGPDAPAFVTKGQKVKKGETLCIIEAMKLMNEVVAERDGEVVEICAQNGNLVEFGQVLFKLF